MCKMSDQYEEEQNAKEPSQKAIFPGSANYKKPCHKALENSSQINKAISKSGNTKKLGHDGQPVAEGISINYFI